VISARGRDKGGRTHQDDLKEHLLVNLHELLVPLLDVGGLLAGVGVVVLRRLRVVLVVFAPFDDLLEDRFIHLGGDALATAGSGKGRHDVLGMCAYVGDGDSSRDRLLSEILHHVLDQHGALGDLTVYRTDDQLSPGARRGGATYPPRWTRHRWIVR
jgi:hypothetical protein